MSLSPCGMRTCGTATPSVGLRGKCQCQQWPSDDMRSLPVLPAIIHQLAAAKKHARIRRNSSRMKRKISAPRAEAEVLQLLGLLAVPALPHVGLLERLADLGAVLLRAKHLLAHVFARTLLRRRTARDGVVNLFKLAREERRGELVRGDLEDRRLPGHPVVTRCSVDVLEELLADLEALLRRDVCRSDPRQ